MRVIAFEETRRSYAAPWARRAALLSAAVLVVGMVAHWFQVLDTIPFFWTMATVAALAVLALILVALGMPKVWNFGYRGGKDLTVAIIVASIVLAPFGIAAYWAFTHPPITDISTDLDDPPAFDDALQSRTADMNAIEEEGDAWKEEQQAAYPDITGRRYDATIESLREAVERTFTARGWKILGPDIVGTGTEFNVATTVYSPVLALPSDVVVRLVEDENSTFVDMRSASRYGTTDFGQNAELIIGFLNELDIAVATLKPVAPSQ